MDASQSSHFEPSLQEDLDRIRAKITEMAALGEQALRDGLAALEQRRRALAYAVIIRDQRIDELEKEIDRLCLEFLVRQRPAAGPLRLAYSAIRVNTELERVGDYAESLARQALKLLGLEAAVPLERFAALAEISLPMLREAVRAFVTQDPELARQTMAQEETVDGLKSALNKDLVRLFREGKLAFEALNPCLMIARRLERVSDQARNICLEALYAATGESFKHPGAEVFRVLFVDRDNACLSRMAEAIGTSLGRPEFLFSSAGLTPQPVHPQAARFMAEKGLALGAVSRVPEQVPNLEHYHLVVALEPGVRPALRLPPGKRIILDWDVPDPVPCGGSEAEARAAFEAAFAFLQSHIQDLVQAILATETQPTTTNTQAKTLCA